MDEIGTFLNLVLAFMADTPSFPIVGTILCCEGGRVAAGALHARFETATVERTWHI